MNADHMFAIGHDHTVCEDYALSGVKMGFGYAIVSDGCSASPDVDVGCRALALAAREVLLKRIITESNPDLGMFGQETILIAEHVFDHFRHLHSQTLDATLLVAFIRDNKITAMIFGDGVFIHRKKDAIELLHVTLTSGAPDYLSYRLDGNRMDSYNKLVDNRKVVWTNYNGTWDYKPHNPIIIERPVEPGDIVAVCSDGINSFKKHDGNAIAWLELVPEFTAFKTTEGEFVQRRIAAFKRKCIKDQTVHTDDISISSIVV